MVEKTLGFKISADWGHYKRLEATSVKQTYGVIPRTTVAGLLAGIVGIKRNEYYEILGREKSDIAIVLQNPVQKVFLPKLDISTKNDYMKTGRFDDVGAKDIGARRMISRKEMEESRQRNEYFYIYNPSYRIYVSTEDSDFYYALKKRLKEKRPVVTPSLGKSECISSVDFLGEFESESIVSSKSDSVVTSDMVDLSEKVSTERVPGDNTKDGSLRKLTDFISYGYNPNAGEVRLDEEYTLQQLNDDVVMFF